MAAGHMGVIVQLAESCAESEERQDELMQCLLRVRRPNARRVLQGWDAGMLFSPFLRLSGCSDSIQIAILRYC